MSTTPPNTPMERIISNFCDEAMLFHPADYTDELGNVLFDKLAEEFKRDFCHDSEPELDEAERQFVEESFNELIEIGVQAWWSRYPLAFKYRNYEYA